MNDNSIQLKWSTISWISICVILLILFLGILNKLDKYRKYNQFENLNKTILSSEYPKRIASLLNNFNKNDSVSASKLIETLAQLEKENDLIDYSAIYLNDSAGFFEFLSYPSYEKANLFNEINYFPVQTKDMKEYLDNQTKIDYHELFNLIEKDKKDIYTLIKVGKGYLLVESYRN